MYVRHHTVGLAIGIESEVFFFRGHTLGSRSEAYSMTRIKKRTYALLAGRYLRASLNSTVAVQLREGEDNNRNASFFHVETIGKR